MTKETKIGLLVGLTFIIVFAIILSEKGTTPRRDAVAPEFTVADHSAPGRASSGSETPLHNAGRLPVESQLTPLAEHRGEWSRSGPEAGESMALSEDPARQALPEDDSAVAPLPESVVSALNSPVIRDMPVGPGDGGRSAEGPRVSLEEAVNGAASGTGPGAAIGPETPRGSTRGILQVPTVGETAERSGREGAVGPDGSSGNRGVGPTGGLSEELVRMNPGRGTEEGVGGGATPPGPMEVVAEHTVQPGESVGKIAARYYGRSTPARVEAIFNANREVLKSINSVKASSKLKIPKLIETGQFEAAPRMAATELGTRRAVPMDSQPRIPIPMGETRGGVVGMERATSPLGGSVQDVRGLDSRTAREDSSLRPAATGRVYEVRKGDTLMKIARAQLGDGGRFEEIYKLNRDSMKNKNSLKPGMKIRLPGAEQSRGTASESPNGGTRTVGRPDVSLATMGEEVGMQD